MSLAKRIYVAFLLVATIAGGIAVYKSRDDSQATPSSPRKAGQDMWNEAVDRQLEGVKPKDIAQRLREADAQRKNAPPSAPKPLTTPKPLDFAEEEQMRKDIGVLSTDPLKNFQLQQKEIERRRKESAATPAP